MYEIAFKNGLGSYYDEDGCDCIIAKIPSNNIPRENEIIELIGGKTNTLRYFLAKEIKRSVTLNPFKEWIRVYVIEIK